MSSPIRSIIRNATRKENEKLNILTLAHNEQYERRLAETGHNLYFWTHETQLPYPPPVNLPDNMRFLDAGVPNLPSDVDFDLVLSPNRGGFDFAKQICAYWHLPLLCLEHTSPNNEFKVTRPQDWQHISRMDGDMNVFVSDEDRDNWEKIGYVIPVDDEDFVQNWDNIFRDVANIVYTRI
jgi:hypothetical protein